MRPVLLVASSGGHLAHLRWLDAWWRPLPRVWVTFDTPEARELLAGEDVVWAFHPTNRGPVNLARNAALAWSTVARVRPSLLVTSGAGVAVPFVAAARGVPSIYLEVIDRIDRPSLTARWLARRVDAVVVQQPAQRDALGRGEVLGPLPVPPPPPPQPRGRGVFVTTGTHHQPFTRLLRAADALAGLGEDVLVQGVGQVGVARHVPLMTATAWQAAVSTADIVITHAGPASIAAARATGRRPLVVGRGPGEHVDDHQLRYLPHVTDGLVVDPVDLVARWPHWRSLAREDVGSPPAVDTQRYAERFEALVRRIQR